MHTRVFVCLFVCVCVCVFVCLFGFMLCVWFMLCIVQPPIPIPAIHVSTNHSPIQIPNLTH